jgi:predicted DsbA family dithiol-disulfide isomerase
LLEKYPKDVKLVYKNFPLQSFRFATKAAQAAFAAERQGKFWEFHEKLFENYNVLNDEKINEIARGLGLDMEKLAQDMNSPAIQNLVARDANEGRRIGIRGIPTILINGKITDRRALADLQAVVEEELKAAQ